ncbi:Uu.00g065350.m01.CDS01 [Anthostomella pinea]|uniref:Uu.00g065350.m01.CDS01 n=1 Tax=Anthostomella pinea TaxID=933095 RepID=A0AAI8YN80_9PEZI|nr:Uu.00g065350.m01.CDS01 [Anthostomella pinea]
MANAEAVSLIIRIAQGLPTAILGAALAYIAIRCIYLLYFHPLVQFPGPKIAAVSNTWYAYQWLSGRYPWATEDVLRKYGDVVRIAPNELLFLTPQAFIDIHTSHVGSLETFVKTDLNDRGDAHGGIAFERDPVRHRKVAKQISPAFSSRSITALEPTMHEHIDLFIKQMKTMEDSGKTERIDLAKWCNWLAVDISADMTYNRKMNQFRDMRNSNYLNVAMGFNRFTTVEQVSLRFPFLKPFKNLFLPFSTMTSMPEMVRKSRAEVHRRLSQQGNTQHLDFFEHLLPDVIPEDRQEMRHLEQLAGQLQFGGFEPVSSWIYGTLMYLLAEPGVCKTLTKEIRTSFENYGDISPSVLKPLQYLNACLEESLRIFLSNNVGMPRISPGAMVDGTFVPKGVYCQTSMFATARSQR